MDTKQLRQTARRLETRAKALWRKRWVRLTALAMAVPLVIACFLTGYYYVRFAQLLDDRLHGARERTFPRVFARPLELRRGQALTDLQLIDRLNDLGYAQRPVAEHPGEFAVGDGSIFIRGRAKTRGNVRSRAPCRRSSSSCAKRT